MRKVLYVLIFAVLLLTACGTPQVPEHYQQADLLPKIYPDYAEVTIPVNMAPLRFELLTGADDAVTRFSAGSQEVVCSGLKARPEVDEWHQLAAAAQGGSIGVEVYAEKDGQWLRYKPFNIYVSTDSIDAWMSFRMISPSYVSYEELTLNQRCLESFDEQVMVDNMLCSTEAGGQCVNCHSYQQWNPDRMQFHARQNHGGTVIAYDGKMEKVDMRHDSLLSAGVYPAWHPQLKLIAYSTNRTLQSFHTVHPNKIEVLDTESDLIVYDVDRHEVKTIEQRPDELEVFPCWSPDGRWLYFCGAHFEYKADSANTEEIILRAEQVKYNIYRKPFDPKTCRFGERQLVFAADSLGMSATLPRVSPDGRWLLFTMGESGLFHIWHHDADLWMMEIGDSTSLKNKEIKNNEEGTTASVWPLDEANSDDTESYHSWSSNGRWVVFSSRRYDGVFTRPFFVHIDNNGHASKPFELPMEDPDRHRQLLKSYNVPELMRGPVTLTPQQAADVLKGEGTAVKLVE